MMYPECNLKKNILFILLTCLFSLCNTETIYADGNKTDIYIPNVRLSDARKHVSNPDSIISKVYEDSINSILNILEDSTNIETAVVVVKNIGDNEAREFATELFNNWGIGDKETDSGLLILLITDKEQRSIIFETGYGIEEVLPDALCSRIQKKHMLSHLKDGRYNEGLLAGIKKCSDVLIRNEIYKNCKTDNETPVLTGIIYMIGFITFIYVIFFILRPLLIRHHKRSHPEICPNCGMQTLLYEKNKIVRHATYKNHGERTETYICTNCGHKVEKTFRIEKLRQNIPTNIRQRSSNRNSGSTGGSWGGGRSGGGGSMTKF